MVKIECDKKSETRELPTLSEATREKLEKAILKELDRRIDPGSEPPPPLMVALRRMGVSTVALAEGLGVGQSTAAAYLNGIRKFPKKHEEKAYVLLKHAVDIALNEINKLDEKIPNACSESEDGEIHGNPSQERLILDDFKDCAHECEQLYEAWRGVRGMEVKFIK